MSASDQTDTRRHGVAVACQGPDGRWLFIRRSASVSSPLRVCFPGGWVEPGESQPEAVIREMREELQAEVEPQRCVWRHVYGEPSRTLWGWLAVLTTPQLVPNPAEVAAILWLSAEEAIGHPDILLHTDTFLAALSTAR
jgi:8-oxo-dGTP pyrophosphatase MutT (NUDIX family)